MSTQQRLLHEVVGFGNIEVGKSPDVALNHYLADVFFVRAVKAILKAYGVPRSARIDEKIVACYEAGALREKARAIREDAKEYERKAQDEAQLLEIEAAALEARN